MNIPEAAVKANPLRLRGISMIRRIYRAIPSWFFLMQGVSFWGMQAGVAEHEDWSKWLQIPYGGIALVCLIIIGHRIDRKERTQS